MNILGINAYHADVSAVLVRDGELVAAVEEERFVRVKHVAGFPEQAIQTCLEMGGITAGDIDHFAVSRNPRANLPRKAWYILTHRPSLDIVRRRGRNQALVSRLPADLADALKLDREQVKSRFHWVEHHPSHLASTFFVSPFDMAAICTIDGFGDFVSTSLAAGVGNSIDILDQVYFPHSLGILYLGLTQYLGFMNYGDEFKVMGLAPYGGPDFAGKVRKLVRFKKNGLFELDLSYFQHWNKGDLMSFEGGVPRIGPVYSPKLEELLGPARKPEEEVEPKHEAIAASLQVVFEEAVFHLLKGLHKKTKLGNLCLAGGCAMNSVANGKIRANTPFKNVYVQPAAADNGTALGAAYHVWNQELQKPRGFVMGHSLWGPEFGGEALGLSLEAFEEFTAEDAERSSVFSQQVGADPGVRPEWRAGCPPYVEDGRTQGSAPTKDQRPETQRPFNGQDARATLSPQTSAEVQESRSEKAENGGLKTEDLKGQLSLAFGNTNPTNGSNGSGLAEFKVQGSKFKKETEDGRLRTEDDSNIQRSTFNVHRFHSDDELCRRTAEAIAAGKVVGWFQGRMEWGARALGNRSIVADPRRTDMRDIINVKIKFREKFRPFAPSILEEAVDEYFEGAVPDPFMIQVYPVREEKRSVIPAVTHVDGSGRLQSVSQAQNPLYWKLIKAFEILTGVPVLLNTSFNENEPIVHRPEEAIDCFLRTDMDLIVLGRWMVEKRFQR